MEVMSKKKRNYSPDFKVKIVLELLRGEESLNEVASRYQLAPATLSRWHKQFLDNASTIYESESQRESTKRINELETQLEISQQKIGQLTLERDWLEKKSDEIFGPNGPHRNRFPR